MHNELYHHGILGQKWGVRRYQNLDGTLTEEGKERLRTNDASASWHAGGYKKLGDLPTVSAYYEKATAHSIQNKAIVKLLQARGMAERNKHTSSIKFSELPKSPQKYSPSVDRTLVNPDYFSTTGAQYNCALCSVAYEMRRRGYNVEANYSEFGRMEDEINEMFTDIPEIYECEEKKDIEKCILENMPDGARGMMLVTVGSWEGRHAIAWEKIDGKLIIQDSQINETYNGVEDASYINDKCRESAPNKFLVYRLDNATINEDKITDAVRPSRADTETAEKRAKFYKNYYGRKH